MAKSARAGETAGRMTTCLRGRHMMEAFYHMVFPGYNAPADEPEYKYIVNDDQSFTILYRDEEVFTSRQYRLRVQAEEGAKDWIKNQLGNPPGEITLDVQSLRTQSGAKLK